MIQVSDMDAVKRIVSAKVKTGQLPDAPSGPIIPRFNAKELAHAIEQEINRSRLVGWTKISIHMTIEDAAMLAKALRR